MRRNSTNLWAKAFQVKLTGRKEANRQQVAELDDNPSNDSFQSLLAQTEDRC